MGAIAIPEDVAAHLQAAIQLSTRRIHVRLLQEAEGLIAQNLTVPAVIIAGTVLESLIEAVPPEYISSYRVRIEQWRDLRNTATHRGSPEITLAGATEMVRGVLALLTELVPVSGSGRLAGVGTLRGRYKQVPTSSVAFIKRKADELGLEH